MKKIDYHFIDKMIMPGRLKANPSGTAVAFINSQSNYENNCYDSNLWLYQNGQFTQLTSDNKLKDFTWQDDENIIFAASRSEDDKKKAEEDLAYTTFYNLPLKGGEAKKFFSLPLAVSSIEPLPNDYYLLHAGFNKEVPNAYILDEEKRKELKKKKKEEEFCTHLTEIPFYFNGTDYIEGERQGLFLYNSKIDQIERISKENLDVGFYNLSEDKKRLYYSGSEMDNRYDWYSGLYYAELPYEAIPDSEVGIPAMLGKELYPNGEYDFSFAWEAGERLMVIASDMKTYGMNESPDIFYYSADKKSLELCHKNDREFYSSMNTDIAFMAGPENFVKDGLYYFVTTDREHDVICSVNAEGEIKQITEVNGAILALQPWSKGFISIMLKDMLPGELYSLQEQGAEFNCERLSNWNIDLFQEYALQKPEYIKSGDEIDIDGWAIYPLDYEEGKSYPALLVVHGGPRTAYGATFVHEMQIWAQAGYFVLFCNPRGSSARGDEFADIRGKYGSVDYEDIMNFLDVCLIEIPAIDRKRLGVTGGSYGGFMTNWIIGHTDRFAAAATQRSISNWISFYGSSDIGYTFACDQADTDTFDQAGFLKLWEHSPLRYINGCDTPTLIIHADKDYRCPLEQGMQMFTALKDRGVDSEMFLFHNETHELSRSGKPKGRILRLKAITEWMDKYLKEKVEKQDKPEA